MSNYTNIIAAIQETQKALTDVEVSAHYDKRTACRYIAKSALVAATAALEQGKVNSATLSLRHALRFTQDTKDGEKILSLLQMVEDLEDKSASLAERAYSSWTEATDVHLNLDAHCLQLGASRILSYSDDPNDAEYHVPAKHLMFDDDSELIISPVGELQWT